MTLHAPGKENPMKKTLSFVLALVMTATILVNAIPTISLDAAAQSTEPTKVTSIFLSTSRPAIGHHTQNLTASVTETAQVVDIYVYDVLADEEFEGNFQDDKIYRIGYVLAPADGYQFADKVTISSIAVMSPDSDGYITYESIFCTCSYENTLQFTMPDIYAGMKQEDLVISTPADKPYILKSYDICDLTDNSYQWGELRRGRTYRLRILVEPKPGYAFPSTIFAYCGIQMEATCYNYGTYAECVMDFALDVGEINLTNLPSKDKIIAGNVTTLNITENTDCVGINTLQWVDANRQPVTTFQDGQDYYVSIHFQAYGPVGPWETPVVTAGNHNMTLEVIDGKNAMVYVGPYRPIPEMGEISVMVSGLEAGARISDVSAIVTGNAVLSNIRVHVNSGGDPDNVIFAKYSEYVVSFYIEPAEGYRIGNNTILRVNGAEHEFTNGLERISFSMMLNTNTKIGAVKANVSGVGIGKRINDAKVKLPDTTKYTLDDYYWTTTSSNISKFQKGERYYLHVTLSANNRFCFSEDTTTVTAGSKKALGIDVSGHKDQLYFVIEYSFRSGISKVSLPAAPTRIEKGDALPGNFKVSSSAKYTLQAGWIAASTEAATTRAYTDDCYVLNYVVTVKKGYEFTNDTVIYIGGKKVTPLLITSDELLVSIPYNVGLSEIDRVDLTIPDPTQGMIPGAAVAPSGASYKVSETVWVANSSDKLDNSVWIPESFQNGKYHFAVTALTAKSGYVFADKVTIYINGLKHSIVNTLNVGTDYQLTVSFGKLGDISKLLTPEIRKTGDLIQWDGVYNADGYQIYRATTKSGKYTLVDTVTQTEWEDTTAAGKTYYYKIKAFYKASSSKNSNYSNVVSITYVCDAPTIAVENDTTGQPCISWEKVNGATKYTVYRATSENGKYSKLGATTKACYTDSKAKAGSTYFYKVIANASASSCSSGYSNIVSCGVICGTPSVTVKIDAANGKPSLSWKKIDGAASYAIYRDGEPLTTVTSVSFKDETAAIDTQYSYAVQALGKTEDLNGSLSKAVSATSGIAKPAAKGSVDTVSGKPVLTWEAVEGAVKYEVYRSTKSSKSYKLVATVEEFTYTDETVSAGKTYYYKVKAIGAVSKSADSSYVKLTGKCATPEISVTNDAKGKPYITWTKVSGAKKYTIYRATSETGKYTKLGTTTKAYYTDSKASAGTTYFYKIVANASSSKNNSPYSNIVTCGVNCAAPVAKVSNNAAGQAVISWAKISGAKQYKVLYMDVTDYTDDVDPHEDFKKHHETAITTQTSFTLPDMDVGRFYMVSVVAVADNEELSSQPDKEIFAVIVPATPKITGKVGENKKPVISWGEVEGATKYVIYRSTSKSKGYKVIGESETFTYEDLTAKKGKTYYYKVVAVGEGFQSAQSAYVKIKSK